MQNDGAVPMAVITFVEPTRAELTAQRQVSERQLVWLARADQARRDTPKPTRPREGFGSDRLRACYWAAAAASAVRSVMPPEAIDGLLGGEHGRHQAGDAVEMLVESAIMARAGADGDALVRAHKAAVFIASYAKARAEWEPGFTALPMSAPLAALLIRGEHERATRNAAGSRGGATVGATFRTDLKYLASLGWPIAGLDTPMVLGAAPKATAGGGRQSQSATLPLKWIAHVEWMAAASTAEIVAEFAAAAKKRTTQGAWVMRFYARSLAMAEASSGRMQDTVRTTFWPDDVDAQTVVRGKQWLAKDGEPLELYAPAVGVLGAFTWLSEHLRDIATVGQAFPIWHGPRGHISDLSLSAGIRPETADKNRVRDALYAIWRAPPLAMSDAARKALGVSGHSWHGTLADIARMISEFPSAPYQLTEDLRRGFSRGEMRMLGHWRRDKNAPAETAPPPRGAGPAVPPGAQTTRNVMEDRYTRGDGRCGERAEQMKVRRRFWTFVQAAMVDFGRLRAGGWRSLAGDAQDWQAVLRLQE